MCPPEITPTPKKKKNSQAHMIVMGAGDTTYVNKIALSKSHTGFSKGTSNVALSESHQKRFALPKSHTHQKLTGASNCVLPNSHPKKKTHRHK